MESSNQIEQVKQRIDILTLVSEYVNMKKAGKNYRGLCPFHQEKTPSFMVSPDLQIFKCFGCNRGGDCFEFLKEVEGIEFREALETLSKRAGIKLKEVKKTEGQRTKEIIFTINSIVAELFHHILLKTPAGKKAWEYLDLRGIKEEAIKTYKLGFAPIQRNFVFRYLNKKGFKLEDQLAAGVVVRSGDDIRSWFFGRVMFPIMDVQGRVVGFSGRILGEGEPKYLNSSDSLTFNKSQNLYGIDKAKTEIKKEKKSVLVEGNLDVISSYQVGVKNVVAPLGTALTTLQLQLLKRFANEVLIAFDADVAGDAATRRSLEIAENLGMEVKIVTLAEGKDPDECIRKSPSSWRESIKEATAVYDFLIDSAKRRFDSSSAEGKRKIGKEILPMIAKMEDELMRAHYSRKIAALLALPEEVINQAVRRYQPNPSGRGVIPNKFNTIPKSERAKLLQKYLLSLVINSSSFQELPLEVFSHPPYKEIAMSINHSQSLALSKIADGLTKEAREELTAVSLMELDKGTLEDPDKLREEIESCKRELYHLDLKDKLASVSLAIKQAEVGKQTSKVSELTKEFKELTEKLFKVEENHEQTAK